MCDVHFICGLTICFLIGYVAKLQRVEPFSFMHSSHLHITRISCTLVGMLTPHFIWQTTLQVWHSINSPPLSHFLHALSLDPLHLLNGLKFFVFPLAICLHGGEVMFHFSISVSCVLCVLPFLSFFRFLLTTNFVSSSLFSLLVAKIPLFWILSCVCFFYRYRVALYL